MIAATAVLLAAQASPPAQTRPVGSEFRCEMRQGPIVERGAAVEASAEDREFLPARWTVEISRPELEDRETDYRDGFVGTPIRASVRWGYRNGDVSGRAELVNSEFDHWTVFYTLMFGPPGEALMMSTYYRTTVEQGVPRTQRGYGHGYCGEIIAFETDRP